MDFAEDLPDSCPPAGASDQALNGVYRLAPSSEPTAACFASHAALGKALPKSLKDGCGWASCSLTTEPTVLKKLSKLRHRYAFKLSIPLGAGLSLKERIHIHFWRSKEFDPSTSVIEVEDV